MRLVPPEVGLPRTARRALRLVVVAAGWAAAPRPALADETMRLDYRAPVGCPEASAFIERVRQRVPTARMATPEELARELVIVVEEDEDGFSARLDFVDVRGETITRTLAGKTCDEVVSGIALVTALALEAQHESAGATPDATPGAAPAEAPASGEGEPAAADNLPEPAPPSPPPAKPVVAQRPKLRSKPSPPRAHPRPAAPHLLYGAGLAGGNAWSVAPGTPLAFDAAFRLGHSALSGSVRVGARTWISDEKVGSRSASFLGYAAGLDVCPVAWPAETPLRVEPCLGTTLGVLEGKGDASGTLPVTESKRILWADVRGILRLRLAVTAQVDLEAQGELGVPLRTHRFLFQNPDETVFQVPAFGPGWRAGVMLHFP